jgi:hypothetical protein
VSEPVKFDFSKFRGAKRMSQVNRLHNLLDKCVSAGDDRLDDAMFVETVTGRYLRSLVPQEGLPPDYPEAA